jgi:hypothetical protein
MSFQAVCCVFDHLAPKVRGPAQHVLLWLANHAHDDGAGIWAAQSTIAHEAGISRRTVQRALERLELAGVIEVREHAGKHGTNRVRIVLCPLCATEAQETPSASERRSPRVRATHKPVQSHRAPTDVRTLAALTAELNIQAAERSPNGDGREGTTHRPAVAAPNGHRPGDVSPSPDPSHVGSKLPTALFNPSPARKEATAGHIIPFQVRSSDAGARAGAARTGSRPPLGAATGDPVLHPDDGRLIESEPERDPARWAR